MYPFFNAVELPDARDQHRHGVNRKDKTQGRRDGKHRHQIVKLSVDVQAVERPLVVLPVQRVEEFVGERLVNLPAMLRFPERPVQNKTVREVLKVRPDGQRRDVKGDRDVRMLRTACGIEHNDRIQGVESRDRIENLPREPRLLAFVAAKRFLLRRWKMCLLNH